MGNFLGKEGMSIRYFSLSGGSATSEVENYTTRTARAFFLSVISKTISGFHSIALSGSGSEAEVYCRPILAISLTTNRERNAEPQQTPSCIIFSLYPDL